MIKGIALFTWDQKIGSVLEVKYPESLDLSPNLINKLYMTHAYSEDYEKAEIIEVSYNEKVILSYCDKSRVPEVGYEIIFIIFDEEDKEKINISKLKKRLTEFGKDVFQQPKEGRSSYLLEKKAIFFKETKAKKILLLGRAGTGKTTIKKIIFEGTDPKDLLYNPLEPTRGITPTVYSWLDLKLGLFDSSGQELRYLLENDEERNLAFENSDYIIYLFDFPMWASNHQDIVEEINKISTLIKKISPKCKFILFLHKIDLISKDKRRLKLNHIRDIITKETGLPIYFTSIYSHLIYNLYNAFYELLSGFSAETRIMKEVIDEMIETFSKIMCFITNENHSIVVQTMSEDFNTRLINYSHKLIANLNETFQEMSNKEDIEHMIIAGSNNLNIIMNKLKFKGQNLNNLVLISEMDDTNKLIWLTGSIRTELFSKLNIKYY
ncbi:MAG: hypothetical protein BAJALOKI2v1_250008 [Promethearchaeota archaeon]|nr:MAG: hypothetical protein BAJALOKI2v1_250008 [Candidatus Lokiarchaeota archaeon]